MAWQTYVLIGGGILILILLLLYIFGGEEEEVAERLERYVAPMPSHREEARARLSTRRALPLSEPLNRAIAGRGFAEDLRLQLARADLKVTPAEFLTLQILMAFIGLVLAQLFFRFIPLGLLGLIVGFFAPRLYVAWRQRRRLQAFNAQLGDAINLMVNGLRAGYSVLQAMEAIARELPPPISTEFDRVVKEQQLGLSLEQALQNMLRRVHSDDLEMLVTAILIQREVGGNLAEILDTISFTIRERVRIKGEIRVLTAQQMISGHVLILLPIGLGLVLFGINRDYMLNFFNSGVLGYFMLACMAVMMLIGYFVIQRIVRIEV
ncbi:MAG: type II secretion system F family protein [Thermoflexus sp.]|uniref:type II secretion system F family protein n=1 Tax=Thermoflexus sp. TaxID=1969742 RepID=UPI0025D39C8C|nr:type II secretion system F family protein [Thermoflexus sp.]MCS6963165.1 type II secretion system F family protein [Thermoflexus sp.]MDW8183859.1 type II secretion system F family protein [Anaerolineae bacterium]